MRDGDDNQSPQLHQGSPPFLLVSPSLWRTFHKEGGVSLWAVCSCPQPSRAPYLRQGLPDENAFIASIFACSQQCSKNGGPARVIRVGIIPAAVVEPRLADCFAVRLLAGEEEEEEGAMSHAGERGGAAHTHDSKERAKRTTFSEEAQRHPITLLTCCA